MWLDKNGETCGRSPSRIVSRKRVERQERRDPCSSETSEELLTKPTKIHDKNEEDDRERRRPKYQKGCEFRENLVDDRVPEGRDSKLFHLQRLVRSADLGKHSVYTHFPKNRNCADHKGPVQKTHWQSRTRAEIFGDLTTADHKVLSENCESRNNHRYAVVGSSRIRVKQKLHRKHREACKSSWSPKGSLKSFTLTTPWNLAKLVKIFPGIIARLHHTDQKQMGLLKEQCAESRKAPLLYCCNQV